MTQELHDYLKEQLRLRGWSGRELGRQAHISNTSVIRALAVNPKKPAGYDVVADIAQALRVDKINLLIKAGLYERQPLQTQHERHLVRTFKQLPAEHQQALVWYADYLFTQRTRLFPFDPMADEED